MTKGMKQVRIAELKARLSEYLRIVRGRQRVAVLDRETPVAHIVPVHDRSTLRVGHRRLARHPDLDGDTGDA